MLSFETNHRTVYQRGCTILSRFDSLKSEEKPYLPLEGTWMSVPYLRIEQAAGLAEAVGDSNEVVRMDPTCTDSVCQTLTL